MADDPAAPIRVPQPPARSKLEAVSAVFTVGDVGAGLAYYRDRLGFTVLWQDGEPPSYAIVYRDAVSMHLQPAGRNAAAAAAQGKSTLYVWVDDVDRLRDELRERACEVAVEPGDTPYGTREMAVQDPDGNILSFAQNIRPGG